MYFERYISLRFIEETYNTSLSFFCFVVLGYQTHEQNLLLCFSLLFFWLLLYVFDIFIVYFILLQVKVNIVVLQ